MSLLELPKSLMFDEQRTRLLTSLEEAHGIYYANEIFDGPSFCFHFKSLEAAQARQFERFAECAYAMLVSWGMHRMGRGGPKMRDFDEFQSTLKLVWPLALDLQDKRPQTLVADDWAKLEGIFRGIRCMATGTSLVAHSKVMAHLLPTLVAPVDREYTLTFLFRNKQITNGIEGEWKILSSVLREFFYPVAQDAAFQTKADEWITQRDRFRWDTSPLKIIDNLVIGLSSQSRTEKEAAESRAASA